MAQRTAKKKKSAKKPHGPVSRGAQVRVMGREVATGQTPGDQPKDDEPSVIQRNLYPQYSKKFDPFHKFCSLCRAFPRARVRSKQSLDSIFSTETMTVTLLESKKEG